MYFFNYQSNLKPYSKYFKLQKRNIHFHFSIRGTRIYKKKKKTFGLNDCDLIIVLFFF